MKRLPIILALSMLLGTIFIGANSQKALAANGANWQAGRIVDDTVFTDASAMSAPQIQDFLNQKVGTGGNGRAAGQCDTNGIATSELGGGTRADYGAAHGNAAPFTCLKDYYEVPKTDPSPGIPASNYGGVAIPPGARSAAQLIWDASQRYNISPKVLLVTIQKESAGPLTTDDWPFKSQYTYAMGAHCPDSGPGGAANCDQNYAGFSIQISESAALLRYYLDNMGQPWWPYKKLGNNDILYQNARPECGSSTVNIISKASAALYTYTPYQPNQPALSNLYGLGDGCSAYGNRNFWRIFTDWFETTYAPEYRWQYIGQSVFADPEYLRPVDVKVLSPGTHYYLRLQARNMGNTTWTNSGSNPVNIGTEDARGRISMFCNPSWLSCNRPTKLKESSVAPGDIGTFEFLIHTPDQIGTFNERFNLVAEGKTWMNDNGLNWPLTTRPPTYSWVYEGQYIYADAARTLTVNSAVLGPNNTYYLQLKARNSGNATWKNTGNNPVNLGTNDLKDRLSNMCNTSWIKCNRASSLAEATVEPGQLGTFNFSVTTPSLSGSYQESFLPVAEGASWMNDLGLHWQLEVKPPTYVWQLESQNLYTDSSKSQIVVSSTVAGGTRQYVVIKAKNTGNTTWNNNGANLVRLGTNNAQDRLSAFCDPSWSSCNRPATLKESSVAPGEIATFEFWITAPYGMDGTNYKEYFKPVAENYSWFNDIGMYIPFALKSPPYIWQYVGQQSYTDSSRTQVADLLNVRPNTNYYLRLRAKNISGKNWVNNGANPVNLGTSKPLDRNSLFCNSVWLRCNRPVSLKEASVAPGGIGTFELTVTSPATTGTYTEYFLPLNEGLSWFNDIGLNWVFVVK